MMKEREKRMLEAKALVYRKAYTELCEVLKILSKDELKKIPSVIRRNLKNKKDIEYDFKLDPNKTLEDQDLLPETKALIVKIYEKFICSEEERDRWEIYDRFCLDRIEEKKREKYNPDVFHNNEEFIEKEEMGLIEVKKKSLIKRFLNWLKRV